jgi:hypothetical protein
VTSDKVVALIDGECPPQMLCVPANKMFQWQVSTRENALFGTEGSVTYSCTDGNSWFYFTWNNPVSIGSELQSTESVGGNDPAQIVVTAKEVIK